MQSAITAVANGMSRKKASEKFGVPRSTLGDKIIGKYREGKKPGRDPFLSVEEEDSHVRLVSTIIRIRRKLTWIRQTNRDCMISIFFRWIRTCGRRGLPPHRNDVLNSVQNMLRANPERHNPFTEDRPGKEWFKSFLGRHKDISVRIPERVSKARVGVTEEAIREWFKELHTNLAAINALDVLENPDRIFNTDETCIQLAPEKTGKVICEKKWKNVYELSPGPDKSTLTFLGTFSASGKIPTPLILYPYQRLPSDIFNLIPDSFYSATSETGWMKTETFYEFLGMYIIILV